MWWVVRIIKISSSNSPPLWTVLEKNKFWHYFYNLTIASERPWLCDIVTCGGHVWNLEVPSPRGPEIDWSEMQKYFKSHGSFIVSDIKYFSGIKIFLPAATDLKSSKNLECEQLITTSQMGGSEVRGSEEDSDKLRTKVFQTKILHNICTTVSSVTPDISLWSGEIWEVSWCHSW